MTTPTECAHLKEKCLPSIGVFCEWCHGWYLPLDYMPFGSEMSPLELALLAKLRRANLRQFSWDKKFIFNLQKHLTNKGRAWLALLAHRYRRQYQLTAEELAYIDEWKPEARS